MDEKGEISRQIDIQIEIDGKFRPLAEGNL